MAGTDYIGPAALDLAAGNPEFRAALERLRQDVSGKLDGIRRLYADDMMLTLVVRRANVPGWELVFGCDSFVAVMAALESAIRYGDSVKSSVAKAGVEHG